MACTKMQQEVLNNLTCHPVVGNAAMVLGSLLFLWAKIQLLISRWRNNLVDNVENINMRNAQGGATWFDHENH